MKTRTACALGTALLLSGALFVPTSAIAAPAAAPEAQEATEAPAQVDNRPDELAEKRAEAKQNAVDLVATGQREVQTRGSGANESKVVEVSPGQWVEYGAEETSQLFTILVDFGDDIDDRFPETPAGPAHNEIPEPEEDDNSTYWLSDFSKQHYEDMFFGEDDSFKSVYDEMSSGRFDVEGGVSDWVSLPENEASYGQTESQADMTRFIQDTADAWYDDQIAQGRTQDEIVAELQQYDQWDRYDLDGDGITNEPDGYIDHFQAVHAGTGEEAGAPEWAIWSHRWSAGQAGTGVEGPADYGKAGGVRIGDTDIWIRDYTTEPENGGLGVFAHEFGHDLGLPDYYDTDGGDNGTAFWTLMSAGSWLGDGTQDIGTTPNHMGATEKMFLGWLDYETVEPGEDATIDLGPSFHATKKAQAALVNLPQGEQHIDVGDAASGAKQFFSGSGNGLDTTVTSPEFTVPEGGELTAQVDYDIEEGWDFAYLEISTDGGQTWASVANDHSTDDDPNGSNLGNGITGATDGWEPLTADLSAYAGSDALVRFRYVTDTAVANPGLQVDDIAVGDALSTDVEDGAPEWTRDGFVLVEDGSYVSTFDQYYLVENRVYGGYDQTLRTGPYNFGWTQSKPDTVEHFPYQDGLLVWYSNGLYDDNNTSAHPGGGQALPVDARAKALTWTDGSVARNRIQSFDATFGTQATDAISLHSETTAGGSLTLNVPSQPAISVFDDTDPYAYYDASNPQGSTIVAGTGTKIEVTKENAKKGTMTIHVTGAPTPAEEWSAERVYTAGDVVTFGGSEWVASWYTQGQEPGDVYGPWQELGTSEDGQPANWTASRIYEAGDTVTYDGWTYQAQWWTRGQTPGDAWGPWKLVS
ncbi:immune inhibitor A domain-containing protein [Microbacterium indicum]|uniref:immune inhibitor A domain-containing protein n=1 Tax=Microbacterium indicum TaxID=358100 RepID=UPI0003FD794E|nr:immune inhibitor A domain-containing protein [Microbacterium indicum]